MKTSQAVRFDNALTNASSNDPKDRDSSAHAEQNPILNALFSTDPVIAGFETIEEWIEHRDTVVQGLNPVGKLETLHAERAAMYLWRLDRVIRFEVVATQFDHNEVFAEFIVALDNKDIPRDRSEAATVEKVRKPLRDYLDEYMRLGAQAAKLPELKEGLDRVRDAAKRVRERRLLPDQPTVQTIIKYESHLDRCLARTMTELRRLQKERRQGLRPVDEFGENPSSRAIFREGEPPCEPFFTNSNRQSSAQSAHHDPEESISGRAILREGEPPCEPLFTNTNPQSSSRSAPRRSVKDMPVSKDLNGRANLPVSRLNDVDQETDDPRIVTACIPHDSYNKGNPLHQEVFHPVSGLIEQNSNALRNDSSRSPSQASSISQQSNTYENGSPGGSPSHKIQPSQIGSPSQASSISQQSNIYENGSPGGSPSHFGSPSHEIPPSRTARIRDQEPNSQETAVATVGGRSDPISLESHVHQRE